ncbi:MAG TPA: NGG1p interacting factor NIF3 [Dissulfurispiraceae bacterium]|nr:NGG1p interacting factor NIF3 [Dissulfurispiraceae bacterium]
MKLSEFFKKAIDTGIANDPRGSDFVARELQQRQKDFANLPPKEKEFFDPESLENPYADSRILYGDGDGEISSILVGIDIEVGEVLLAETLGKRGSPIDLIVSHHPEGRAYATLYSVMYMQADILSRFGVPINIAEDLMEGRVKEIERRLMPINHSRAVDAARLLDLPFACLHTPADNMVASYLQALCAEKQPYTLEDLIDLLRDIPEYRDAEKVGAGPRVLLGSKKRKAGKVFVDMTGGTEGSKEIFQSMTMSGINTMLVMHLSEEHRTEAEKHHVNVVLAGHIASDNIGVNLLLDKVLDGDPCTVHECSGFRRFRR